MDPVSTGYNWSYSLPTGPVTIAVARRAAAQAGVAAAAKEETVLPAYASVLTAHAAAASAAPTSATVALLPQPRYAFRPAAATIATVGFTMIHRLASFVHGNPLVQPTLLIHLTYP